MQELLEVRDFVNEGGRVLYTGQRAGQQYTTGLGTELYDPFENRQCSADPAVLAGCLALSARATRRATRSSTCSALLSPRRAVASTRTPATHSRSPASTTRSAASPGCATGPTALRTRPRLVLHHDERPAQGHRPGGQLPAVRELAGGRVPERPGGPVRPAHGDSFMWSDRADEAYKRLTTRSTCRRAAGLCRSGPASTWSRTSTT